MSHYLLIYCSCVCFLPFVSTAFNCQIVRRSWFIYLFIYWGREEHWLSKAVVMLSARCCTGKYQEGVSVNKSGCWTDWSVCSIYSGNVTTTTKKPSQIYWYKPITFHITTSVMISHENVNMDSTKVDVIGVDWFSSANTEKHKQRRTCDLKDCVCLRRWMTHSAFS